MKLRFTEEADNNYAGVPVRVRVRKVGDPVA